MTIDARARILAIDDDPEVLRLVEQTLADRFECEFAGDLPAAREKLEAGAYDLALCNVELSGEAWPELVKGVVEGAPKTAVVLLAERDDPGVVDRALALGVHGYLVKPLRPGQALIAVQAALRHRELEAAEQARRRSLGEQVRAAVDRAPVPIYVKDLDRRYLLANQVSHELAGLEPGELIGRTDADTVPPESELLIREGDMRVLRDGEACEREATVNLGGRERTFLSIRFPYLDPEGNLAGITGVSVDITAQREAERLQRDLATARERAIEELQSSRQETVERLSGAIELHDPEAGRHVGRLARISSYLGSQVGLDDDQIMLLRAAAPMHDIGKVVTPGEILLKPGPLTPEERAEMERHAEAGHKILADSESELLQMAARIALTHHEWFDGGGYPRGLRGEEIPIEGRIVAVADVFDALLSDRPYRPALGLEEAVEAIRQGRGTQFDPEIVDVLLEHLDEARGLRE
jgi:putative two-component system response regulator